MDEANDREKKRHKLLHLSTAPPPFPLMREECGKFYKKKAIGMQKCTYDKKEGGNIYAP